MADKRDLSKESQVRALLERSIAVKQRVAVEQCGAIVAMADRCTAALAGGGKLMLCGNGGSAADAQHLAAELLVRLRPEVNRDGVAAIALALDPSSLTACGNDYSFEFYFERMLRSLGRRGDALIAITTSGKSPNVVRALQGAREMGIAALGLLGGDGQPAVQHCDMAVIVPSRETGRIQESHITIGHALMELIEDGLLAGGHTRKLSS